MPTDTKLANLVLNVLTEEQYDAAEKVENELYLIEDDGTLPEEVAAAIETAVNTALEHAKESGEFDGEKGDKGDPYTLTDTDKNAIAAAVRSTMTAADVGAGTFAGQVVANASGQAAGTSLLRNSKLTADDTVNPTVEGEIVWVYK